MKNMVSSYDHGLPVQHLSKYVCIYFTYLLQYQGPRPALSTLGNYIGSPWTFETVWLYGPGWPQTHNPFASASLVVGPTCVQSHLAVSRNSAHVRHVRPMAYSVTEYVKGLGSVLSTTHTNPKIWSTIEHRVAVLLTGLQNHQETHDVNATCYQDTSRGWACSSAGLSLSSTSRPSVSSPATQKKKTYILFQNKEK